MSISRCISVFPGQGSQYPGMSKVLRENFPWTIQVYEEASDALKENLLQLCEEGPADQLQLTANAQPAILVTSYAWFEVLRRELDFSPVAAAGHSLGEYTAILASGAIRLSDAIRLVRIRGEAMQSAVPAGKGKMAAVLGLSDEKVIELCEKASEDEHSLVVPANFNAPSQVVIAGHAAAVERAEQIAATDPNFKARKVIPLKVSAPFHSPLMKPASEKFLPFLSAVSWSDLKFPIVFNVDAERRSQADFPSLLRQQMDHPVLWTACVKRLCEEEPSAFIEVGPGKVLTGLIKRIAENVKLFSLDSIEDFRLLEKAFQEGK